MYTYIHTYILLINYLFVGSLSLSLSFSPPSRSLLMARRPALPRPPIIWSGFAFLNSTYAVVLLLHAPLVTLRVSLLLPLPCCSRAGMFPTAPCPPRGLACAHYSCTCAVSDLLCFVSFVFPWLRSTCLWNYPVEPYPITMRYLSTAVLICSSCKISSRESRFQDWTPNRQGDAIHNNNNNNNNSSSNNISCSSSTSSSSSSIYNSIIV